MERGLRWMDRLLTLTVCGLIFATPNYPCKRGEVAIVHLAPPVPLTTRDSLQDKIWQYGGERPVSRRNLDNLSLDSTPTEQKRLSACPTMVFSTRNNPRIPRMALAFLWQIMPSTTIPIRPRVTRLL